MSDNTTTGATMGTGDIHITADRNSDDAQVPAGLDDAGSRSTQILLPSDILPPVLHLLPQEHRPFFPGQAIPLLMNAEVWLPTLMAVKESKNNVVGVVLQRGAGDGASADGSPDSWANRTFDRRSHARCADAG